MKFSEIWYVDLVKENSPQSPIFDFRLFWPFFLLKRAEIDKNEENWQNPNRLMKFSEIWYVDASKQTKNATKKLFLDFGLFWPFLTKKQCKKKHFFLTNSELLSEIF